VLRAVDLHRLAQAIAPPAWMRGEKLIPTFLPQPIPIIQPRKVSRDTEQP